MKKLTAILVALIMCLSFAACGDEGANTSSSKYIPGGTYFGMSVDEVLDARKDAPYGVEKSDLFTKRYGHTVVTESINAKVFKEYFGDSVFGDFSSASIYYHFDDGEKLYAVEAYLSGSSESAWEDGMNVIVGHYEDLIGEEPEIEGKSASVATATWKMDDANIVVEIWDGDTIYSIETWIVAPDKEIPEYI